MFSRWYYENNSKKCLIFKWSGCGGNKNNFRSKIECQQKCGLSKVPRIRHQHRRRRRHRPHQHSNNLYNTQKHHFNNNLQHVSSNHPNTCSCYRPMLFSLLLQQAQLQQQLQQLLLQQQQHLLSLQPLLPLPQFFQQNTQRTFKSKMNSDSNNHNNMKRDNDDFFPDHYDYNEYKDYQYNFYNDNSNENHQNNNIESIKNDDSYGSHNDKSYPPNGDVNIHEGGHVEITTFSPINNHIQLPRSNENYNWYLNQPEQQNSPKSYSNDYNNIQNNGIYANHQPKNSNPQVNYHETYSQPKFDSHSNEDLSKKSQMELKNKKAHMKLSRLPNEKYFMQESPVINKIKTSLLYKLIINYLNYSKRFDRKFWNVN